MMIVAQAAPGRDLSVWRMVVEGTPSTQAILAILLLLSVLSWVLILWKVGQFSRLGREADRCLSEIRKGQRLEDAYRSLLALPESPFTRVFKRGVNFFSELRPGTLRSGAISAGLSPAQLEILRLTLEREEDQERAEMNRGLIWLAITATVGPLLGLLGTVVGVMESFLGVTRAGTASINAVAPGMAEALIATAAGLVAAIPAAVAYNYFSGRLASFASDLEGFSSAFLGALAREGRI